MKNKSIMFYELEGRTACKYLLAVGFASRRELTDCEINRIRRRSFKKCIDHLIMTFLTENRLGAGVLIFDCYVIEELNFFQRIRHGLRVLKAAIFDYIGVSSVIIVIK
jgi:hypothetical protein